MLFLITLSWTDIISSTVTVSERKPSWEFFTRSTDAWVKCKELENSGDVVISNDYTLGWVSKCFSVAFLVLDVTRQKKSVDGKRNISFFLFFKWKNQITHVYLLNWIQES